MDVYGCEINVNLTAVTSRSDPSVCGWGSTASGVRRRTCQPLIECDVRRLVFGSFTQCCDTQSPWCGKWVIVGRGGGQTVDEEASPSGGSQITDTYQFSDVWLIQLCGHTSVDTYIFSSRSVSLARSVFSCVRTGNARGTLALLHRRCRWWRRVWTRCVLKGFHFLKWSGKIHWEK